MEEDRYNINNYTDNELYDLLDLTNPTDRVLEAKIISMINKYSTNVTEEGLKITNFFYEIYNHFFESNNEETEFFGEERHQDDEEVLVENYEDKDERKDEKNRDIKRTVKTREGFDTKQIPSGQTQTSIYSQVAQQNSTNVQETSPSLLQSTTGGQGVQSSIKVNQLDYTKDKLNPLLKQTIKRIISIDSQFRNIHPELKLTTTPTNFTFNLSEPLKDVVSLSLYSVQIPYTWYTINKNYGGNFFYLKGNSAGINEDPAFSYKIEIAPGNYKPQELVDTINKSIEEIKISNPDVSFGYTKADYSSYTNNASIKVDIKNYFNERNYQLQFSNWSYPLTLNDPDSTILTADNNQQRYLQSTNIGAYLGFNSSNYNINSIYSINNGTSTVKFNNFGLSTDDNTSISDYNIITEGDNSNNYFTIIQYYNIYPISDLYYTENSEKTNIIQSIPIYLTLSGIQGRKAIEDDINNQLQNNSYLTNSYLKRIDISGNTVTDDQNFNKSYYQLTINLNKKTTQNLPNAKTVVVFPDETNITTGTKLWVYDPTNTNFLNCCFNFPNRYNELGDITAESYSLQSSFLASYSSSPYIELKCNVPGYTYDISVNAYKPTTGFPISSVGISLDTLITNINNNLLYHNTTKGNIFTNNTSLKDTNLNSQLSFTFDFNVPFDNTYFLIDFPTDGFFSNFNENGLNSNIGLSNMLSGNGNITTSGNTSINGIANINGYFTLNGNLSIDGNVSIIGNTIIPTGIVTVNGNIINGNTNINTLSNGNVSINGNLQINSSTSTYISGNINVFGNNTITGNTSIINSAITTGISKTFSFTQEALSAYQVTGNLFTIRPTTSNGIIDKDITWNIPATTELQTTNYINVFVDYVNARLKSFYDINYHHIDGNGNTYSTTYSNPLSSSFLSYNYNTTKDPEKLYIDFNLTIIINKILTQNDYTMYLREVTSGNLWSNDLYFDSSYNLNNNYVVGTTYSQITNNKPVGAYTCKLSKNTTITLQGITNGLSSTGGENDIFIDIPAGTYTRTELFKVINTSFSNNPITTGSVINIKTINGINFVYFHFNINKIFNASDYRVVFYDVYSFVNCYQGYTKQLNSTWDSTLGWILGFREQTEYYLSSSTQTITGDTAVSTNIYNYFLIVLDDYTQSHLNDGLVTITKQEGSIPLPSYANRTLLECDNNGQQFLSGSIYDKPGNNLTQKQVYAANQILLSKNRVNMTNYSSGPFIQDIFGIIPVKVGGIPNGGYYVEFGGTLQNQQRLYFGPVNISRFTIKLIDDRGNLVDLNNANWSFSFICEQLYQQTSI